MLKRFRARLESEIFCGAPAEMVDQTAYFDALAASWEERFVEGGSMSGRLTRFRSAVCQRLDPGSRILDFGCGTGDITVALARANFQTVGVDSSRMMVQKAVAKARGTEAHFALLSQNPVANRLPSKEQEFSAIVASSVLEYVSDLDHCLAELNRVAIHGAWLLASVPNPCHPIRILEHIALHLGPTVRPILPRRLRDHLRYIALSTNRFTIRRWKVLLQKHNWNCVEVSGYLDALLLLVARKAN